MLLFFLIASTANANETLVLNSDKESYTLGKYLYYFQNSTGQEFTIDRVSSPDMANEFIQANDDRLNLGFLKVPVWMRIEVKNLSTFNDWLLDIAYPNFDYIDFYYQDADNNWQVLKTGDMREFSSRPISNRRFLIPLPLDNAASRTFYIRFNSSGVYTFPMDITRQVPVFVSQNVVEIFFGMYYGLMMIMFLYNLIIFVALKDRSYLLYSLSIFFGMMFVATVQHHTFQYLWPKWPVFQNYSNVVSFTIWYAVVSLFADTFLDMKKYSKAMHYLYYGFVGVSAISLVLLPFLGNAQILRLATAMVILTSIMLIVGGVICLYKGVKSARHFVTAWTFYLCGTLTYALKAFGLVPDNFLTDHSVEFGSALEVILIAAALTDKYREMSKEKKHAEEETKRVLKESNEQLEQKVEERTREIQQKQEEILVQNEELQQQQEEILAQRDAIEEKNRVLQGQNVKIREQHQMITDSIRYAKDIQRAILPMEATMKKHLPEHFVFFKPKDIVSGDFYWFSEVDGKLILAAVDCTGHGVPGAFMSMVGNNLLNKIIKEKKILQADEILNYLHIGIREVLKQAEGQNHDGMDLALVVIDHQAKTIDFAGAKSPMYYLQDGNAKEIRGYKKAIGGMQREEERKFEHYKIRITSPITFYLFSDGFQDQFGDNPRKKYSGIRFRELLSLIHQQPLDLQKSILEKEIKQWMGSEHEQLDDMLVIGVRIY